MARAAWGYRVEGKEVRQKVKAIVAGGGLGGLAAALRLRAAGWEVTVCDNGPTPGGKMNRWSAGGFVFDTGPTLLTMPHVLSRLFAALGERIEDHLELEPLDPHAEYIYPDGSRIRVPARVEDWLAAVREIAPADAEGVGWLHELGERIYRLSEGTFFLNHPLLPFGPPAAGSLRHFPLRHAWGNYARTVARFVKDHRLRRIYNRYPTYVGSSPYRCPATLLVIPYIEHTFGAWRVKGGMYRIVGALLRLAKERGVEVMAGAAVAEIEGGGERVTGVRLEDGRRIESAVVVFNGDSASLEQMLDGKERFKPESRSLSGVILLAGLRTALSGWNAHTVVFSADYEREFADLFERSMFPEDPTVYVYAPRDEAMAPSGAQSVFLMANAPGDGRMAWDEAAAREASQRMLERIRRSGLAVLADSLEVFDVWHPGRFEKRFLTPGGSIYGENSHGWRRAFLRAPNRVRGIRGLYCTGGSYHPGGGVPMVLISAEITVRLILRDWGGRA